MKRVLSLFLVLTLPLFVGCAVTPQYNVSFDEQVWENKEQKVGVYVSAIPKIRSQVPGAGCLLCLATASAIHAPIAKHIKTQSTEDLQSVKAELIAKLRDKGMDLVVIEDEIDLRKIKNNKVKGENVAKKDYSAFGTKYGIDRLFVLDITYVGSVRNFANYIPVGDPFVSISGTMYLVNTTTNTYEMYEAINIQKFAEGKWKEAPNYPGLTNAFYTAIELAKDDILDLTVGY
ncbi:MAG: hypothetical protein COA42_15965 [Alteromonadaceae bacterium]|nr:MAG: hypothetical protein COA42_15965 [Alteromonadaceae bacterium]